MATANGKGVRGTAEGREGVKLRAPDGGWGWMVAIGSYFVNGLTAIPSLSFSILFSPYLLEQSASSTLSNWIPNIHLFLLNFTGVFIGPLIKEVGFRRVSVCGAILASFSFLSLIFINSVWYLMAIYGITAIFFSLAAKPSFLIISQYFDRKRGKANAFLMAGICSAQFAGPPLIRYLLDEYSLRGAILILGGIFFNVTAASLLYQPVEWHMKPVEEEELDLNVEDTDTPRESKLDMMSTKEQDEMMKLRDIQRVKARHMRVRQISECSYDSLALGVSQMDLSSIPSLSRLDISGSESSEESETDSILHKFKRIFKSILRLFRSMMKDLLIMKSPRAIIIIGGGIFTVIGYMNFLIMVPFFIQSLGYSLSDAAWCISIAATTNMFARLSTSLLSDCSWFNMRGVYMFGATVLGVSTIVFGFLTELMWMQVMMGIWGYGVGTTISLYVLLMPRYMGNENMAAIFGTQSFAMSFAFLILGPLFGFIRDASESYTITMVAIGVSVLGCVVLWAFMPLAVKKCTWKPHQDEEIEDGR